MVAWERLEGLAFFYGFVTLLFLFLAAAWWSGASYSVRLGKGRGHAMEPFVAPFTWLGDRAPVAAPAGLLLWAAGTATVLLVEGPLGFLALAVGFLAFVLAGLSLLARLVAPAAEAGLDEEPPEEYPWERHVASHLTIWTFVTLVFWFGGVLQESPWLWPFVVLGFLQIPVVAYWNARRYDPPGSGG